MDILGRRTDTRLNISNSRISSAVNAQEDCGAAGPAVKLFNSYLDLLLL